MNAQRYLINGRIFTAHDPALQEALARIYETPARPRCMCIVGGIEMYVSKFNEFVIKRMPETGANHRPTCASYELPASESGLGQVLGSAIIDRGPDGVELRLDFPLTRRLGRRIPAGEPQVAVDVIVACKKLSLRGLLSCLWDRAGLNRWFPRMQGKRSYGVVRKFLRQACEEVQAKGLRLAERVFIPESFLLERAAEITQRRKEALAMLFTPDAREHFKMMIAIGEVKVFNETTLGYRLVLKHLPDCPFFLEKRAGERTKRVFQQELLAWSEGLVKLIAACLFHARHEHCYQVDAVSLMMTSDVWIPLDHVYEKDVIEKLVAEQRAFIKPLRYEARHAGAFPNFQLLDAGMRPVALDVLSAFLTAEERAAKVRAIGERQPQGWVWDIAEHTVIPHLPPKADDYSSHQGARAPEANKPATTTRALVAE